MAYVAIILYKRQAADRVSKLRFAAEQKSSAAKQKFHASLWHYIYKWSYKGLTFRFAVEYSYSSAAKFRASYSLERAADRVSRFRFAAEQNPLQRNEISS